MTNDEILEQARLIKNQRMASDYQKRLAKAKQFAEKVKENPVVIEGLIGDAVGENGSLGYHEVNELTRLLSNLPDGTKIKATIQVLEVGPGVAAVDDEDLDFALSYYEKD